MNCSDYSMILNIVLTNLLIISEILAFRHNSNCCSKQKKDDTDTNNKPRINGIIQGIVSLSISTYSKDSIKDSIKNSIKDSIKDSIKNSTSHSSKNSNDSIITEKCKKPI